jgi:anti-sigma factor RsiW
MGETTRQTTADDENNLRLMNEEQQLRLQAFLDHELGEQEARDVASWVARDREAAALVRELRNTRQALSQAGQDQRVPETREFYWSKLEREIQRLQPSEPVQIPSLPWMARFRRVLVSAGAVAALAVIVFVAGHQSGFLGWFRGAQTEMTAADAGMFTYKDYANGTTLVWMDYPAER